MKTDENYMFLEYFKMKSKNEKIIRTLISCKNTDPKKEILMGFSNLKLIK